MLTLKSLEQTLGYTLKQVNPNEIYLTENTQCIQLADDKLQALSIRNTDLSTVPETIFNLTSLEILFLASNHLTEVSEQLGNLYHLTHLFCIVIS